MRAQWYFALYVAASESRPIVPLLVLDYFYLPLKGKAEDIFFYAVFLSYIG